LPEYRNPNQAGGGSTDNRGLLVMMLVMVGVIFGAQWWRAKHNTETAVPSAPAAATQPASAAPPATAALNPPGAPVTPSVSVPAVQAAGETTTVVENSLYKITFSNRGGEVRSWILKRYKDKDGLPLDLVHQGASNFYGYPLSLHTYEPGLTAALADGLYVASATGNVEAPASLTFNYAAGNVSVMKTFSFGSDYVIHADTQLLRNGVAIAGDLAWPAGFGDMETAAAYGGATLDTSSVGKSSHEAFKKVVGGATLKGPFDYAGTSDQYFAAIFLPDHVDDASLVTLSNQIDVKDLPRGGTMKHGGSIGTPYKGQTLVPVIGSALGSQSGHVETRLFVGPKDYTLLKGITTTTGDSLVSVIDFGFWGYLSQGLFLGLRAVHSWIAPAVTSAKDYSWGWAIVIFTVLLNLVLLPLRVQGMKGMLKMQRIQPQIDAIKASYGNPGATDPKSAKMNADVMDLQKKEGVSMFGGCVPTLIQFPLLFAFFTMMTRVVELRQAHWFWLHDLSAADPYKILPIIMVVTSFLVQFYTPSPGVDPQQARMMAFMMPAFSGYMTWNYASGLALYWNIGNFIMILQQMVMNRTKLGMEMRELQRMRAAKKKVVAPTGRTLQGKR
jgi:YidC/Oxa1 family membrane protein insertase